MPATGTCRPIAARASRSLARSSAIVAGPGESSAAAHRLHEHRRGVGREGRVPVRPLVVAGHVVAQEVGGAPPGGVEQEGRARVDAVGVEAAAAALFGKRAEAVGEGLRRQRVRHDQLAVEAAVPQMLHQGDAGLGLHGENQHGGAARGGDLARDRRQAGVEAGVGRIEGPAPCHPGTDLRRRRLHDLGQVGPVGVGLVGDAEALRSQNLGHVRRHEAPLGPVVVDHAEVPGVVARHRDARRRGWRRPEGHGPRRPRLPRSSRC